MEKNRQKSEAHSDVIRFRVGQIVLVPCEILAVDADDELYPVKIALPDGVVSGRDARWLHIRDLPAIKEQR